MAHLNLDARNLGLVRRAVDETLAGFLDGKAQGPYGSLLEAPLRILRGFLDGGGKRVRPLYLCVGWHAVEGRAITPAVLRAAAGIELFHTFALLHDDVIDGSDTRHGLPTVPRQFASLCAGAGAGRFGDGAAVLLGDLCEVWSTELLEGADMPALAREALAAMRTELVVGQYLDLCAGGERVGTVEHALKVIHYKTTKYTVERPLQIGAALAGADHAVLDACTAYARPVGEAFQLLDDLQDVLPEDEGGTADGSDLREGKHTVVLTLAVGRCTTAQAERLRRLVGDRALDARGLAEARALIAATGAPETVKAMILEWRRQAMEALGRTPFHPSIPAILRHLTDLAIPQVAAWPEAGTALPSPLRT